MFSVDVEFKAHDLVRFTGRDHYEGLQEDDKLIVKELVGATVVRVTKPKDPTKIYTAMANDLSFFVSSASRSSNFFNAFF